jgi:hypothetical protein
VSKKWLAVMLAAAVIGAVTGTALASIPDGNGVIHGCVKLAQPNKWDLFVIDSATMHCADLGTNYHALNWNQTGPQGPRGYTGAQGPQGIQGPVGPKGADGKDGKDGAKGATGARGPTGPAGANGGVGPTGPPGPKGDKGEPGSSADDGTPKAFCDAPGNDPNPVVHDHACPANRAGDTYWLEQVPAPSN